MKKSISFHLLPVLVMLLCLSSCSETTKKTEYTHSIPSNVTEMASLDVKSIVSKAGLNDAASKATLQELLGALFENKNAALKEEAETLLQDPAESGIDWSAPVYLFKAPTLHSTAIALKIADLKKFEAMLELFAQEQLCAVPVKVQGYHSVEIKDAGVLLAYNDGKNCNRLSLPSCNSPPTKASMQTNISLQCYSKREISACWQLLMPCPWMCVVY